MSGPAPCPCGAPDLPIPTTGNDTKCLACGAVVKGPAVEAYGRGDE